MYSRDMKDTELAVITRIKSGDRSSLHKVYLQYRGDFLDWASARFNCDEETAKDIWQEVMIIFYENIVEGKLVQLTSKLRTYLFGIGRNLLLRKMDKAKRWVSLEAEEDHDQPEGEDWGELTEDHSLELSERQQMLRSVLAAMGPPCQPLLLLFYYHRYTMESIMERLKYKNADVAKSQKARCMRTLRKQMSGFQREDI